MWFCLYRKERREVYPRLALGVNWLKKKSYLRFFILIFMSGKYLSNCTLLLKYYFLKICTVLKYYWDWKPVNVLVHLHFDQNHSVPITYFLFFLIFFLSELSVAVSFASHVKFKHQSLKFTIKFKEVF